jgi:hypothetical protein
MGGWTLLQVSQARARKFNNRDVGDWIFTLSPTLSLEGEGAWRPSSWQGEGLGRGCLAPLPLAGEGSGKESLAALPLAGGGVRERVEN